MERGIGAMDRTELYSLLLLAGGKSSRMGKDKAELFFHGQTFLQAAMNKAAKLGIHKLFLSGYRGTKEGGRVIRDIYRERGPLGGIHACMKEMDTPYCLVLPVDVPQLPLWVLEKLLRQHCGRISKGKEKLPLILVHGVREEPLIGIYPTDMVSLIEEEIREHSAPVLKVLKKRGYECCAVELLPWEAENINTPEAYEELLEHDTEKRGR